MKIKFLFLLALVTLLFSETKSQDITNYDQSIEFIEESLSVINVPADIFNNLIRDGNLVDKYSDGRHFLISLSKLPGILFFSFVYDDSDENKRIHSLLFVLENDFFNYILNNYFNSPEYKKGNSENGEILYADSKGFFYHLALEENQSETTKGFLKISRYEGFLKF